MMLSASSRLSLSFPALLMASLSVGSLYYIQPTEAALSTDFLSANNLNFTCTVLKHNINASDKDAGEVKKIMLLHGFPMFRVWWDPLLSMWDDLLTENSTESVHALACDLRGYSPGASPDDMDAYDYPIFATDTFALAEAAFGVGESFDLLGHDHGAALAWYVADNDPDNLVTSLTTMSVPHIGLMSEALCGDNVDEDQVIAVNYFNQFSLPDSATANNAGLTGLFQAFGLSLQPDAFQKILWWYKGFLPQILAMPRVVSDDEIAGFAQKVGAQGVGFIQGVRQAIPMEERECIPPPDDNVVGTIAIPTLFICGLGDTFLLCNNTFVTDFPPDLLPDYEHANYQCGHDFFLQGHCVSMEESQKVMDKITGFVLPNLVKTTGEDDSGMESEDGDDGTASMNYY